MTTNIKDIIQNIEQIYGSNSSLSLLKDFERVIDELDTYVYDNWIDGELVVGPIDSRYFITCTFMWDKNKMPDPTAGKRLVEYGCKVEYGESYFTSVRKIKKPEDIRPGTKKGKLEHKPIWLVRIKIPKKLINDITKGYNALDRNKIKDLSQSNSLNSHLDPAEEQAQRMADNKNMQQPIQLGM
jgi:hypothetical protein